MKVLPILLGFGALAAAIPATAKTPILDPGRVRVILRDRLLDHAGIPPSDPTRIPRSEAATAMSAPEGHGDRASRIPPGLAFLMSAALPGTGQLAEGRNRAFAYLGLEAISWVAHFAWQDAGNKKEGEYQAYARQHWSLATWDAHVDVGIDSCEAVPAGIDPADARNTLVNFLEAKNYQHYYEDIGKLEAYRAGWDDFDCEAPGQVSPHRTDYRAMRAKSNDYLDKARSALTIAFLNRVVSAVDAYRTARGAHLRIAGADLKIGVAGSLAKPKTTIQLTKRF